MKKINFILVVFLILFAVSNSYSQNQVSVHVTGGYDLPMQDLKGTIGTDTNNYLQKSGFNIGADVKYYLGKKRNAGITLSGSYNGFTSGTYTGPSGNTALVKINIFAIGIGAEYAFMPKGKANPFIGVEFTGNFISGSGTYTFTTGPANINTTLNSATRFGVQFNGGVDIKFSKSFGAVIGIKYNLANLIGKKYDTTGTTTAAFNLNDASYTDSAGNSVNAKNIGYIQLYAGVALFFGRNRTMK